MTPRARWQAFFWTAEPVLAIRRYRVLLGLWTLALIGERLPYLAELYALPVLRSGLVKTAPPIAAVYAAAVGLVVAVLGVVFGRWPRRCAALVLVCFAWLAAVEVRAPRAYVVLALVQWLLVQVTPAARTGEAPRWGTRLVMLQFSTMYGFAAAGKLLVADWRSGEAVVTALQSSIYGEFLVSAWLPLDEGPWPWAIAWGTIVGELFIAVGLWWSRTRSAAIVTLVGLHLGIALTLRVSWLFHALMLLHVVLFVRGRKD